MNKYSHLVLVPSHFQGIPTPPAMTCQHAHMHSHFLLHTHPHSPSFSYNTTTLPICWIPSPYICQFFSLFHWLWYSTKLRIAPLSPASTAPGAQMLILKDVMWVRFSSPAHTIGIINGTQVLYKCFVNETLGDGGGGACIHTITALHFTHWISLNWHDGVSVYIFACMSIYPQCKKRTHCSLFIS